MNKTPNRSILWILAIAVFFNLCGLWDGFNTRQSLLSLLSLIGGTTVAIVMLVDRCKRETSK